LPPEWLQIRGQTLVNSGITNENGSVWGEMLLAASGNDPIDVTPKATRVYMNQDYTFDKQVTNVTLRIVDAVTGLDLTDKTTDVVVGQQISLLCKLSVTNALLTTLSNFQWTVPGYAISNYVATVNSGIVYSNFPTVNSNVVFYWVDGANNRQVQCSATVNGQQLSTKAVFDVQRPNIQLAVTVPGEIRADNNYAKSGTFLHFGGNSVGTNVIPGIKFEVQSTDIDGEAFYIQTGNSYEQDMGIDGTNYVWTGSGVDNGTDLGNYEYRSDGISTDDSPASSLFNTLTNVNRTDSFTMYLMFQPNVPGAKLMVPMNKVSWSWSGSAVLANASSNLWNLTSAVPPSNPTATDTTSYPTWTTHIQPGQWVPCTPPTQ
jgi:hypothetical protein